MLSISIPYGQRERCKFDPFCHTVSGLKKNPHKTSELGLKHLQTYFYAMNTCRFSEQCFSYRRTLENGFSSRRDLAHCEVFRHSKSGDFGGKLCGMQAQTKGSVLSGWLAISGDDGKQPQRSSRVQDFFCPLWLCQAVSDVQGFSEETSHFALKHLQIFRHRKQMIKLCNYNEKCVSYSRVRLDKNNDPDSRLSDLAHCKVFSHSEREIRQRNDGAASPVMREKGSIQKMMQRLRELASLQNDVLKHLFENNHPRADHCLRRARMKLFTEVRKNNIDMSEAIPIWMHLFPSAYFVEERCGQYVFCLEGAALQLLHAFHSPLKINHVDTSRDEINLGVIRMAFDYISMYCDYIIIQNESEREKHTGRLLSIDDLYENGKIDWQIGEKDYGVVINVGEEEEHPVVDMKHQFFDFSNFEKKIEEIPDGKSVFLPDLVRDSMEVCAHLNVSKSPYISPPDTFSQGNQR